MFEEEKCQNEERDSEWNNEKKIAYFPQNARKILLTALQ
jgi:hypothetical protein